MTTTQRPSSDDPTTTTTTTSLRWLRRAAADSVRSWLAGSSIHTSSGSIPGPTVAKRIQTRHTRDCALGTFICLPLRCPLCGTPVGRRRWEVDVLWGALFVEKEPTNKQTRNGPSTARLRRTAVAEWEIIASGN